MKTFIIAKNDRQRGSKQLRFGRKKLGIDREKQCFYSTISITLPVYRYVIASQEHAYWHPKAMLLAGKMIKKMDETARYSGNELYYRFIRNQLIFGLFATTDNTTCKYVKHREVGCQENSSSIRHESSTHTGLQTYR